MIPASVIRIDAGTFSTMGSLSSVSINGTGEDTAISIGAGAFGNCYNLPNINTPQGRIMVEDEL